MTEQAKKSICQGTHFREEKGRTELLGVAGLGEAALISLYRAGIYNRKTLADCNLADAAAKSGLSEEKLASYKEAAQ